MAVRLDTTRPAGEARREEEARPEGEAGCEVKVWLFRHVSVGDGGKYGEGWFARVFDLPLPPLPGLGVVVPAGDDLYDCDVESVTVGTRGAVYVQLEDVHYDDDGEYGFDQDPEEGHSQFRYETDGWVRIPEGELYDWPPPE